MEEGQEHAAGHRALPRGRLPDPAPCAGWVGDEESPRAGARVHRCPAEVALLPPIAGTRLPVTLGARTRRSGALTDGRIPPETAQLP